MKIVKLVILVCIAQFWSARNSDAAGFTNLFNFSNTNGASPNAGLVLSGGRLYGTASRGGAQDGGSIFAMNTDGTGFSMLRDFAMNDGDAPYSGLVISSNTLYGTTRAGGAPAFYGTVFAINTDGNGFNVVNGFSGTNGVGPNAGLVLSGSALYGTTVSGGTANDGIVFRVNSDGTGFTNLFNFNGTNGAHPYAGLTLAGGTLFGATYLGGSGNAGTIFKINTDGSGFTVLKDLSTTNTGANPYGDLLVSGNTLYGTTYQGGSGNYGTVFKLNTNGIGFTVLKDFTGVASGANPYAALVLSGGRLYGTTHSGGSTGNGVIFKINTDGSNFAVVYSLSGTNGSAPNSLLLSDGVFYGTTTFGGSKGYGTVFAFQDFPMPIPLQMERGGSGMVLNWVDPAFSLQCAPTLSGPFTNIDGAVSPHTNQVNGSQLFFRLISH